jgi:hypothetical protein
MEWKKQDALLMPDFKFNKFDNGKRNKIIKLPIEERKPIG